jgi:hypothetical protein
MKPQSIWFIALFAIGIALILIVLIKKKEKILIPFYLAVVGLSFSMEYYIKILLNCYVYYPNLLPNRYYDDILGANASQAFVIPAVVLFISSYQLNIWYILLFTGIFAGIEQLFLALNIYEHIWWKTWYTVISLLAFFLIGKKWLSLLKQNKGGVLRFLTLLFACFSFIASLFFYTSVFFHSHAFHIGWVENKARDNLIFSYFFYIPISLIYTCISVYLVSPFLKVFGILLLLTIDWIFWRVGITEIYKPWAIWYFPITDILTLLMTYWMYQSLVSTGSTTNDFTAEAKIKGGG